MKIEEKIPCIYSRLLELERAGYNGINKPRKLLNGILVLESDFEEYQLLAKMYEKICQKDIDSLTSIYEVYKERFGESQVLTHVEHKSKNQTELQTDNFVITDQHVEEFENKYKSFLFEKIGELHSSLSDTLQHIKEIERDTDIESDLPNIMVTLNNKIIELQQEFQKTGLSMYSTKHEKDGYVGSSFLGNAIINDLMDRVKKGLQLINDYTITRSTMLDKKNQEMLELKEKLSKIEQEINNRPINKFKKLFKRNQKAGLDTKDIPIMPENALYNEEEKAELNNPLLTYIDFDSKLWNYNLRENIIESIVKEVAKGDYGSYTIPELLEARVFPDLKILGLENLIEELKKIYAEEYNQNVDPTLKDNAETVKESKKI